MGDTTYKNWKARLEGAKVLTHDGDPDVGFYRKPVRADRKDGNHIIGWEPVAYFMDGTAIVGVIGDRDMTANEVTDLWTYVCAYPIPEEVYRAVAENGEEWPAGLIGEPKRPRAAVVAAKEAAETMQQTTGQPASDLPPAADGRAITRSDNQPPEELPLVEKLKERIKNAKAVAESLKEPKSDEEATNLAGARNLLNELKGEAEKEKERLFRPLKDKLDEVTKTWNPVISDAETAAKAAYKALGAHEQKKRDLAAAEAKRIEEENRRIAEQNEKAIDKAFETGNLEQVTLAEPKALPEALKPSPSVRASYGRATAFREQNIVEITDYDAVYANFKDDSEVKALLLTLAKRSIDAGISVPGTTSRRGIA